jgi:hypothetical protein
MSLSCLICCPECKASLLGEHGVGCAWYAERILECIVDAIADEPSRQQAAQRADMPRLLAMGEATAEYLPRDQVEYLPRDQFQPFHPPTQRWVIIVAPCRAGKTAGNERRTAARLMLGARKWDAGVQFDENAASGACLRKRGK